MELPRLRARPNGRPATRNGNFGNPSLGAIAEHRDAANWHIQRELMHRRKYWFMACLAASLPAVAIGAGACEAQGGAERVHLVELYTSEGCNSCPPAEKWMSSIRDSVQLIGLEFHVNYWDSTAWRDPYAKQAYANRQEARARRAAAQVYTPQIWLDGKLWRNWPKGDPPDVGQPTSANPAMALSVSAEAGEQVKVSVRTNSVANAERKRIYVALTENGLVQQIRGGENKGRWLEHDQVVRDFAGPLRLPEAQAELKLPAGAALQNVSVVAYVQDEDGGGTEQVLRLPLKECK